MPLSDYSLAPGGITGYGPRMDGTQKGEGYFGPLTGNEGISTELSFGFNNGGKEVLAPLLVPTLSKDEINHLLGGNKPTLAIYSKAIQHATERMTMGKSPWSMPNEITPLPR